MGLPYHLIWYIIFNYHTNECTNCTNYITQGKVTGKRKGMKCASNYCYIDCKNALCEYCAIKCQGCNMFYCSKTCFNSITNHCYWCECDLSIDVL